MRPLLHDFDLRATTLVQGWPESVRAAMLVATFIGEPVFTVGIGIAIAAFGWFRANVGLFTAGVIAIGTVLVGAFIKLIFHRPRPLTEYVAMMRFETFSFPSGHAVGSTVTYGLLAYLLWHFLPAPWNYIVAIGLVGIIVLIGISRIYLGAHFPSDVVAGWLVGGLGLVIIIFIVQPRL